MYLTVAKWVDFCYLKRSEQTKQWVELKESILKANYKITKAHIKSKHRNWYWIWLHKISQIKEVNNFQQYEYKT